MDEICGFNSTGEYPDKSWMSPENLIFPSHDYCTLLCPGRIPTFGSDELLSTASAISEAAPIATPEIQRQQDMSTIIKAKIASHPCYPRLLEAYIDCQKVGAPPEIAYLLDEIQRENYFKRGIVPTCLEADPELDEFMETYCDMLVKYKSDLARPFDEATTFLNKVEMQLRNICISASFRSHSGLPILRVWRPVMMSDPYFKELEFQHMSDVYVYIFGVKMKSGSGNYSGFMKERICGWLNEDGASSDVDYSGGEMDPQEAQAKDEDRDLKDKLLSKFGSHIGSLKLEFSKKKKKVKLPKEARQTLLDWWNVHYKWPYPTEADKLTLAESTGLDQKQINNWFINQRKRHWKPSENMQFAVIDNLSGPLFTHD